MGHQHIGRYLGALGGRRREPAIADEKDLSAIPNLVEIGQKMAADMDWKQTLT